MRIERLTSKTASTEAVLRFETGEPLRTSDVPGLAASLLRVLPGLKGHRCDNGAHTTFPQELADTEIAHAVEHAALELMAMAGSPDTLRGRTEWDFARTGRGVFAVRIEHDDPAVARGAVREACALLEALARGDEPPDVVEVVCGLRAARGTV